MNAIIKAEQKTEVLRARVEPSFKQDVLMLAKFKRLDEADIIRIAVGQLLEKFKAAPGTLSIL